MNMSKIIYFCIAIFLVSCSNESQINNEQSNPKNLVEYTWMNVGPNFTAENLASLIDIWNNMLDEMGCSLNGANILTPKVSNEEYDFIWVHLWTSLKARDDCWETWTTKNYQSSWDDSIDGIIDYDLNNVYLFKPTTGRSPKKQNISGTFVNTFYFCSFNNGYSVTDLDIYQKELLKINSFSDLHWYVTLEPMFDSDEPQVDFIWLDLWGSEADKISDQKIWQNTDLPSKVNKMASCSPSMEGVSFMGTVIRR